jgi:hypothetical protein
MLCQGSVLLSLVSASCAADGHYDQLVAAHQRMMQLNVLLVTAVASLCVSSESAAVHLSSVEDSFAAQPSNYSVVFSKSFSLDGSDVFIKVTAKVLDLKR